MATLNRVLIVMIALMAIAAALLSFLLFKARHQMKTRADKLANTTAEMVDALNQNSNTSMPEKVSYQPPVPGAGVKEKGTLAWKEYRRQSATGKKGEAEEFKANLKSARNFAKDMNKQRNYLAKTFTRTAQELGMEVEGLEQELRDLSGESPKPSAPPKIERLAEAVRRQILDLREALVTCGKIIEQPVKRAPFEERQEERSDGEVMKKGFKHQREVKKFVQALKQLYNRTTDYEETLKGAIAQVGEHDWSVEPAAITNKHRYSDALTAMKNDFIKINEKLIKLKKTLRELENTKEELENTLSELKTVRKKKNEAETQLGEKKEVVSDLEEQLNTLKERLGQAGPPEDTEGKPRAGPLPEFNPNQEAHVLEVNKNLNFVILDVGRRDNVTKGLEFVIGRKDDFVAKAAVSRVTKKYSVAELLAEPEPGKVSEGDRAITSD